MTRQAMWYDHGVDLLQVGALKSKIRLSAGFDWQDLWVYNTELSPQPCGLCFGTGRHLKVVRCMFCSGRGHSPDKNSSMDRIRRAAEIGFKRGEAAGQARAAKSRNVIDADWAETTYKFPEPESHTLCGECLSADCEGDCE
jgi:hypothetical protein